MSEFEKSKPRDPRRKKALDNANQRKIASNSSDKASRKNAPRIKAMSSRHVRRREKSALSQAMNDFEQIDGQSIAMAHKVKPRHWGSDNAAELRAHRCAEREFLDQTPISGRKGRGRATKFRAEYFISKDRGKK